MKQFKQWAACALTALVSGGIGSAFDVNQYTNVTGGNIYGTPQTTNGVTFVFVTSTGVVTRITSDQRWTANNVYVLDKMTFVGDGATLVVEPGTVVRGERSTRLGVSNLDPADPGTLLISKGGKLIANGTAESPITFTSIADPFVPGGSKTVPPFENGRDLLAATNVGNANYVVSTTDNPLTSNIGDNAFALQGLWGGVILCGKARVGANNNTGTNFLAGSFTNGSGLAIGGDYVEGFQAFADGAYGGTDDNDSSGVMRFCSLRYCGFSLAPNNEINALTLCGVGRETVVEFVETYNCLDDGFEWFGGCVNTKYLASLFSADDGFDWDEGFRGNHQFWFVIQGNDDYKSGGVTLTTGRPTPNQQTGQSSETYVSDALLECDGAEPNNNAVYGAGSEGGYPFSIPTIYNLTAIGRGNGIYIGRDGNDLLFKESSGGKIANAIVMQTGSTNGLSLVNTTGQGNRLTLSRNDLGGYYGIYTNASAVALSEPDLVLKGISFYDLGTNGPTDFATVNRNGQLGDATVLPIISNAVAANTVNVNPSLRGVGDLSRVNGGVLDPRPSTGSAMRDSTGFTPANSGEAADAEFVPVSFRGAFRDNVWLRGWSILEYLNVLTNGATEVDPVVTVSTDGTDPVVSFTAEANAWYSIERSTDGKVYNPFATHTSGSAGAVTVTNAGAGVSSVNLYRVIKL